MYGTEAQDIYTACKEGDESYVRQWLARAENDVNRGDGHGFTPLHWATRYGRTRIVEMLCSRAAKVNASNMGGDAPLHIAVSFGQQEILYKLIAQKANVNATNEHGNTPLHYACFWCYDQIAIDLVSAGGLVSMANKYGETPLHRAKNTLKQKLSEKAIKLGQNLDIIPFKEDAKKKKRANLDLYCRQPEIDFRTITMGELIGSGSVGEIYKGSWGRYQVCIKKLRNQNLSTQQLKQFNEEVPKLRLFTHLNILPVIGMCSHPPNIAVISEYIPLGSLHTVLHPKEGGNPLDNDTVIRIAQDIARGMAFLHAHEPAVHGYYLSSNNVMLEDDMTARLSLPSVHLPFVRTSVFSQPSYLSPEAARARLDRDDQKKADMWSFAVLFWEMVTGLIPHDGVPPMLVGIKIGKDGLRPEHPETMSPSNKRFLDICWNRDPLKRPSFERIIPILEKMAG
ncbi:hypothetical protein ACHWQZ_G003431 [Mnemiopsis leidyi]